MWNPTETTSTAPQSRLLASFTTNGQMNVTPRQKEHLPIDAKEVWTNLPNQRLQAHKNTRKEKGRK
jgi:hypothetical protein